MFNEKYEQNFIYSAYLTLMKQSGFSKRSANIEPQLKFQKASDYRRIYSSFKLCELLSSIDDLDLIAIDEKPINLHISHS